MATTKGTAIAAPQIFQSDPLEQLHAKGLTDPDMGGLSYAFYNAARGDRARNQDTYLNALRESNMMAQRLAAYESDQELLGKALTSAAEMANAGIDPNLMPVNQRLYGANFGGEAVALPSSLSRDKKRAEAEHLRAQSAAAGQGGADTYTVQQNVSPGGVRGDVVITGKGRNPAAVQGTVTGLSGNYGTVPVMNPDGTVSTTTTPTTPQARTAAGAPPPTAGAPGSTTGIGSNARAQGEAKRQAEAKARAEANKTQQRLEQVK